MKRKLTALLLTLSLLAALGASAAFADNAAHTERRPADEETESAAAAEETAAPEGQAEEPDAEPAVTPDAEGTLSFENIGARMHASYYPILALEESVRFLDELDYEHMENQLREQLNDVASMQWMLVSFGLSKSDEYKQMEQAYNAMREQFDAIREGDMQKDNADALRQLRNAQNQMIVFGESLFIALKGLDAQDAALSRQIAQLDRTIKELRLREELGQIPALTAQQAELGRTQAQSGRQTLRMNRDNYLLQLESMVGAELGEPLALGELPKVTAAELEKMDLEADLETAREASYSLFDARKTYEDARDTYLRDGGDYDNTTVTEIRAKHTFATAQYTYDNEVVTFELNFRVLYAQVKDCAQVLSAARAALAEQEREYAVSALKFEQGNISANALSDAKDELAAAKAAVTDAERELFSKYRSYQWAVEYGILNS
ncbi:MAG: TolC family protein [Ruminococcaceae bacterium]|nr:TolC family protein [Oscillospiraceae bacterium]